MKNIFQFIFQQLLILFLIIYFQRMQTINNQRSINYKNIEILKSSYKLQPPKVQQWRALSNGLKIHQIANIQSSLDNHSQQTWSEQFSYNGFIKTKQLFKNKNNNNSILQDDFTNEHIYSAEKIEDKNIGFQFNSFGRHEQLLDKQGITVNPRNFSSNEIGDWNSSSLEINFDKAPKNELCLPDPKQKVAVQKYSLPFQNTISQDSQVKQFCYRLSDSSEIDLQKTPIKKWTESKRKTQAKGKKEIVKSIIMDFMERLDKIPADELTFTFIEETKNLFENIGTNTQRIPFLESKILKFQNKLKDQLAPIQESSSSTIRLHTQNSNIKHNQRQKNDGSSKNNGKFKIYECSSRNKQNTENKNITPVKSGHKIQGKQKRFRF